MNVYKISGKVFWRNNGDAEFEAHFSGADAEVAIGKFKEHAKSIFNTEEKKKEGFVFDHVSVCSVREGDDFIN